MAAGSTRTASVSCGGSMMSRKRQERSQPPLQERDLRQVCCRDQLPLQRTVGTLAVKHADTGRQGAATSGPLVGATSTR